MLDPIFLIQTFGYIGLFVIIFAESGVLLGFFLPGDSLLFTAGFLASQDVLSIFVLLPLLFIAALAGDQFGYYFGRRVGPAVFTRPKSIFFNPANVERTTKFFEKHGRKTIVLARFIPIVRTLAPVMAGVGQMKYRDFLYYNFIGALLWAVGITLLGFVFGNIIPDADKYLLPIIFTIIFVSFIPPIWHLYKEKRSRV